MIRHTQSAIPGKLLLSRAYVHFTDWLQYYYLCYILSKCLLKLRGFLISFSAANTCEAKNTYLSLLVNLLVNDIKENLAYQATVAEIIHSKNGLSNVAPRKHVSNSQARSWKWSVLAWEIVWFGTENRHRVVLLSSDQITLGSSELKTFATTGYSPGFYPNMSFCTLFMKGCRVSSNIFSFSSSFVFSNKLLLCNNLSILPVP